MDLPKVAEALHMLADALVAPVENVAVRDRPAGELEPQQTQQTRQTQQTPAGMDFSVFNTELRNLSVQMGPGKLGPAIQPLLAKYAPEGGGIGGIAEQQREAFLNEVRAFVQGAAQ